MAGKPKQFADDDVPDEPDGGDVAPWGERAQGKEVRGHGETRSEDRNGRDGARGTRGGSAKRARDDAPRPSRPKPRSDARRERSRAGGAETAHEDAPVLFGLHAIAFALRNPDRVFRALALTENAEVRLKDALASRERLPDIERVRPKDLDRRLGSDTVHQGAMAVVDPLADVSLQDLAERASAQGAGPLVLLDQVTDPHNVGAVLRSAAVFGASGLIMTRRHSPPLAGALAKSASGALELVPIALVQNLARALEDLKQQGVNLIGLDGAGEATLDAAQWSGATAVVLGAEGRGLRQSTAEGCDLVVRIPADGPIASLNVSNAAALVLYEAQRGRRR